MSKNTPPLPAATHYASPGLLRRFAAMVYDSLLLMAISILYGAIMTAANVAVNGPPAVGERISWGAFGLVVFIGWLLSLAVFFCYFWHKSGQTLGMKTWRIKMVQQHNLEPPRYSQCIARFLLAPISLCLLGIGYWLMYSNPERQTLHDQLSNTRLLLLAKKQP